MRRALHAWMRLGAGLVAGLVAATGAIAATGAGAAGFSTVQLSPASGCQLIVCVTPAPRPAFSYHGGYVLSHPIVYLVRFSASRTALVPNGGFEPGAWAPTGPSARNAVLATLTGPRSALFNAYMVQDQTFRASFGGTLTFYDPLLATERTVDDSQISHELATVMPGRVSHGVQAIATVLLRTGQSIIVPGLSGFCAYHSAVNFGNGWGASYAVVPYDAPNLDSSCSTTVAFPDMTGTFRWYSMSHELEEAVTDPIGLGGWYAGNGFSEVADLCENGIDNLMAPTVFAGTTYYLAMLYDAKVNACLNGPIPTALEVSSSGSSYTVQVAAKGATDSGATLRVTGPGLTWQLRTDATGTAHFTYAGTGVLHVALAANEPFAAASTVANGGPVPVLQVTTSTNSVLTTSWLGPTRVAVALTLNGGPLAGATVDVVGPNNTLIASGTTAHDGTVTLDPASYPGLAWTVVVAGTTAYDSAQADATADTGLAQATTVSGSGPTTVTVQVAVGFDSSTVYVVGDGRQLATGTLNGNGTATLPIAGPIPAGVLYVELYDDMTLCMIVSPIAGA